MHVPVLNANTQSAAPSLLSAQGEERSHLTKVLSALLQDWTQGAVLGGAACGADGRAGANGTAAAKPLPTYKGLWWGVCLPGGISLRCAVWVQVMVTRSRLGDGTTLAAPPTAGLLALQNLQM